MRITFIALSMTVVAASVLAPRAAFAGACAG